MICLFVYNSLHGLLSLGSILFPSNPLKKFRHWYWCWPQPEPSLFSSESRHPYHILLHSAGYGQRNPWLVCDFFPKQFVLLQEKETISRSEWGEILWLVQCTEMNPDHSKEYVSPFPCLRLSRERNRWANFTILQKNSACNMVSNTEFCWGTEWPKKLFQEDNNKPSYEQAACFWLITFIKVWTNKWARLLPYVTVFGTKFR